MSTPSLSVLFPAYNDGGTIASMVVAGHAAAKAYSEDHEVIVVNDGSSDYTGLVLAELRQRYPCLKVIEHSSNQGYGGALRSGMAVASKELLFYTDGDAQYDPGELRLLLEALSDEIHVVNGYKLRRSDGWHRILLGAVYRRTVRWLFQLPIRDVDCDFRLMRRGLLRRVILTAEGGAFPTELVRKLSDAGARFAEVGVHHYARPYGASQFFRFKRIVELIIGLARLWRELQAQPVAEMATPAER